MEENLEQAHDARLMDFEAGIADGADSDRVSKALEEGKVDDDEALEAWPFVSLLQPGDVVDNANAVGALPILASAKLSNSRNVSR
ncbi:MAG: hypothetical protein ACLQJR_02775 [Stellaceae bacterium]